MGIVLIYCNTIGGLLDSIKEKLDGITGKIGEFDSQVGAYFFNEAGKKAYAYGIRIPIDYSGELPKQMLCIVIPQRNYIVFSHPHFDYKKIGGLVSEAAENAFNSYGFIKAGYEHDKQL